MSKALRYGREETPSERLERIIIENNLDNACGVKHDSFIDNVAHHCEASSVRSGVINSSNEALGSRFRGKVLSKIPYTTLDPHVCAVLDKVQDQRCEYQTLKEARANPYDKATFSADGTILCVYCLFQNKRPTNGNCIHYDLVTGDLIPVEEQAARKNDIDETSKADDRKRKLDSGDDCREVVNAEDDADQLISTEDIEDASADNIAVFGESRVKRAKKSKKIKEKGKAADATKSKSSPTFDDRCAVPEGEEKAKDVPVAPLAKKPCKATKSVESSHVVAKDRRGDGECGASTIVDDLRCGDVDQHDQPPPAKRARKESGREETRRYVIPRTAQSKATSVARADYFYKQSASVTSKRHADSPSTFRCPNRREVAGRRAPFASSSGRWNDHRSPRSSSFDRRVPANSSYRPRYDSSSSRREYRGRPSFDRRQDEYDNPKQILSKGMTPIRLPPATGYQPNRGRFHLKSRPRQVKY